VDLRQRIDWLSAGLGSLEVWVEDILADWTTLITLCVDDAQSLKTPSPVLALGDEGFDAF